MAAQLARDAGGEPILVGDLASAAEFAFTTAELSAYNTALSTIKVVGERYAGQQARQVAN